MEIRHDSIVNSLALIKNKEKTYIQTNQWCFMKAQKERFDFLLNWKFKELLTEYN